VVHDAEGTVVVVLPGTLVVVVEAVVVVETVVVVAFVVEVLLAVVVVDRGGGFFARRTTAPGLSTSNAAQRARGPTTAPHTARVRIASATRPFDASLGAAPPASAATRPTPTTRRSAIAPLHNFREIPARIM
jgi:hypothetical protein